MPTWSHNLGRGIARAAAMTSLGGIRAKLAALEAGGTPTPDPDARPPRRRDTDQDGGTL